MFTSTASATNASTPAPAQAPADVTLSYRHAESLDHWAAGVHMQSNLPLDCWLNRTFSAEALDAELLWAQVILLDGNASLVIWWQGGPLFHSGVDAPGAPRVPGLYSFILTDHLRVSPGEGFRDLEFRLLFNRVAEVDWEATCRAPAQLTWTGSREVALWGLDSIEGTSVRVSDTASRTKGTTPAVSFSTPPSFVLCSHGATGTASLGGGTSWQLTADMECEAGGCLRGATL